MANEKKSWLDQGPAEGGGRVPGPWEAAPIGVPAGKLEPGGAKAGRKKPPAPSGRGGRVPTNRGPAKP